MPLQGLRLCPARGPPSSPLQPSPLRGLMAKSAAPGEVTGGESLFAGGVRDWYCHLHRLMLRV